MTKEQYTLLAPYTEVCKLFATSGSYVGGADGLFELYRHMFNLGQKVNTSCPNCIGSVLLDTHNKLEAYERNL